MNVCIEVATAEHLCAINEIYNHYVLNSNTTFETIEWDERRRLAWFLQFKQHSHDYHLLVAKIDQQVIGFSYNARFKEKPAYSTSSEVTVYIKPGFERQGLGVKLYNNLLAKIAESALHRLYAAITLPNTASTRLHEKLGFTLLGTMEEVGFKNGSYHSVALYEKRISP